MTATVEYEKRNLKAFFRNADTERDPIYNNRVRVRIIIILIVWLVSRYAHVFVLLFVFLALNPVKTRIRLVVGVFWCPWQILSYCRTAGILPWCGAPGFFAQINVPLAPFFTTVTPYPVSHPPLDVASIALLNTIDLPRRDYRALVYWTCSQ